VNRRPVLLSVLFIVVTMSGAAAALSRRSAICCSINMEKCPLEQRTTWSAYLQ